MNLKLNNEIRGSQNVLKPPTPHTSSVKEERRRTGRYIAILVGISLFLLAMYHAWVRRIPIVASLVVPALIMFIYVAWVLYTASRDKHKPFQMNSQPFQSQWQPFQSQRQPGRCGSHPGCSGSRPGCSGSRPERCGSRPGRCGDRPGRSGSRPGRSGSRPGRSGSRPGRSGSRPGCSGSRPGCNGSREVCSGSREGWCGSRTQRQPSRMQWQPSRVQWQPGGMQWQPGGMVWQPDAAAAILDAVAAIRDAVAAIGVPVATIPDTLAAGPRLNHILVVQLIVLDAEAELEASPDATENDVHISELTQHNEIVSSKESSKLNTPEGSVHKEWIETSSPTYKEENVVKIEQPRFIMPLILINDKLPEEFDQKYINIIESIAINDKFKGFPVKPRYKRKFCRRKNIVFKRSYSIA